MTTTDEQFPFEQSPPGAPATQRPASTVSSSAPPSTVTHEEPPPLSRGGGGGLIEVEKSRAVQEVQAALVIAKRFPRDEIEAIQRIRTNCQRYRLAETAFYRYKRGGQQVIGPTIRMAEMLAGAWGNLTYGFRELENTKGVSQVEAYCWDLQSNTKSTRQFTVAHQLHLKDGKVKHLTDPRDVYEMVANQAQRRVRACILQAIPGDVVEEATDTCNTTLRKGPKDGVPFADRVRKMATAFKEGYGVTTELLEKYLKHPLDTLSYDEFVDLTSVFNALKEGKPREEFFDIHSGQQSEGGRAAELEDLAKPAAANNKETTK